MPEVNVKDLLEAGVHFGHQTHRWNPKMRPYIYTQRDGIHIIDLSQTSVQLKGALKAVTDTIAAGREVLFVGTKRQAQGVIETEAKRASQPFVMNRWLGGMLTNYKTVKKSIDRLLKLLSERDEGVFEKMIKKEALGKEREIAKLEKNLSGVKNMKGLPGLVFIIDPKTEEIARKEANKLKIPVVAICDTNCDPDNIDYLVVANDDAIRSIEIVTKATADACLEGVVKREHILREEAAQQKEKKAEEKKDGPAIVEKKIGGRGRAYVGRRNATEKISEQELEKYASARADSDGKDEEKKPAEKAAK